MFSWSVETFDELPSTQDLAKARAAGGAPEGTLIEAEAQSAGYGRHGREWVSLEGNFFCSSILRPGCSAQKAGELALLTGEALAAAMRPLLVNETLVGIKKPNDVLLDGKKCAGVLIESELAPNNGQVEWVVVGVGVNIAAAPEGPFSHLNAYARAPVEVAAFKEAFLKFMQAAYSRWKTP